MILIFNGSNFESIRVQLNELHGIPLEGKPGVKNGVVRTDGMVHTMNRALPTPPEGDGYIQIDSIEQFVIDAADEVYTGNDENQYLIDRGFKEEIE